MSINQADLFETPAPAQATVPSEELRGLVRTRLHATLALVKAAETMPWTDQLAIIREDNGFRYAKGLLPKAEGDALWAAFDVEMDRLYAVLNEGKELDSD